MAYSYSYSCGKKSFGVFSEPLEAGEYINNKKAKNSYCISNKCVNNITNIKSASQSNLLMFKQSYNQTYYPYKNSINRANLNFNLITKLDLEGVPVISDISGNSPTPILVNSIPFIDYTIDPCGNLFGNTVCGINNYTRYMVYNYPDTK